MILIGDALTELRKIDDESVQCCVTSPPYWGLRDYGVSGQIGLELTPDEYVMGLVEVFREVRRVLRRDGTLWLNLGDTYATGGKGGGGSFMKERGDAAWQSRSKVNGWKKAPPGLKDKDLVGIPWRVAFALQADGWYLRQDIIWAKPNPMPESVRDRCTKSHEYVFLLSKKNDYFCDMTAIKEGAVRANEAIWDNGLHGHAGGKSHSGQGSSTRKFGSDPTKKNRRSVWTVKTSPFKGAHFATMPPKLVEPCVKAASTPGQTVLDPFFGAGTVGLVAGALGRKFIGIELNPEYAELARRRLGVLAE